MKKWCKACQGAYPDREGGIVYDSQGKSLHWLCQACTRRAKVSGDRRVRALADILDEEGSAAVDAALDEVGGTAKG